MLIFTIFFLGTVSVLNINFYFRLRERWFNTCRGHQSCKLLDLLDVLAFPHKCQTAWYLQASLRQVDSATSFSCYLTQNSAFIFLGETAKRRYLTRNVANYLDTLADSYSVGIVNISDLQLADKCLSNYWVPYIFVHMKGPQHSIYHSSIFSHALNLLWYSFHV